jgi:hypothetical protein
MTSTTNDNDDNAAATTTTTATTTTPAVPTEIASHTTSATATTTTTTNTTATPTLSQMMRQKIHWGSSGGGNNNNNKTSKSVWSRTLETFRMSDGGKTKDTDLLVPADDMAEAVRQLTLMIPDDEEEETDVADADAATTTTNNNHHNKWNLDLTEPLLVELQKTKYDLYRAFLKWSRIEPSNNEKKGKSGDGDDEDNDETNGNDNSHNEMTMMMMINVTKAFRRLDSYVTWMEDNRKDLELPITIASIGPAAKAWACRCNYSIVTPAQPQQRFVWFLDFGAMDIPAIQTTLSHADSLRYIVFLSHVVMLDEVAQDNGMMIVQSMSHRGMWESLTLVPLEIGTKTDRLTIGTLPIKMKACYIVHGAKWIRILAGLMKPFMSAKMRQRIIVVNDTTNLKKKGGPSPQDVLDAQVGRQAIPRGFAGLEGSADTDLFFGRYMKE